MAILAQIDAERMTELYSMTLNVVKLGALGFGLKCSRDLVRDHMTDLRDGFMEKLPVLFPGREIYDFRDIKINPDEKPSRYDPNQSSP